ncbi:cDC42 small effector protein 1 isoform X1 [Gallus gallus]|uniref:cDC42 small effector protein 1 isoform X1 n=1 Tax=Gallus gallus TaxID=9031 RepID=UPI001F01A39D|nr:cDC42 small effector protein 1 isoform X1 [Gallus gallus]
MLALSGVGALCRSVPLRAAPRRAGRRRRRRRGSAASRSCGATAERSETPKLCARKLRPGTAHCTVGPRRPRGASPTPQVPPPARPHGLRAHGGLCSGAAPAPPGGKLEGTANMSDFWHKLGCCVVEKPQPKKRRRRIDRSMIGEPMNFVHLTHIGSGDMAAGEGLPMTGAVQEMRSKGGRERQWSSSRVL